MDSSMIKKSQKWMGGVPPWVYIFLCAMLLAPLVLRLSIEWTVNAQYYYGWSVPLLAAYLFYERTLDKPAPQPARFGAVAIGGILLLALPQVVLRLVGEANTDWRLISWGMGANAIGIVLCVIYLLGGWAWVRQFGFPILFLATAIPWPTGGEQWLVQGMMRLNATVAAEFVSLCGVPAIATGNVIELSTGVLGVNEACSGIRSLQSTLMASIFLGELYRLSLFGRFVLVGAGVGVAFLLNVVRTIFLSWQGAFHGIEATEKWHDTAGFAILAMVLIFLWLISRFLEKRAWRDSRIGEI